MGIGKGSGRGGRRRGAGSKPGPRGPRARTDLLPRDPTPAKKPSKRKQKLDAQIRAREEADKFLLAYSDSFVSQVMQSGNLTLKMDLWLEMRRRAFGTAPKDPVTTGESLEQVMRDLAKRKAEQAAAAASAPVDEDKMIG